MVRTIADIGKGLVNIIYPPLCVSCGQPLGELSGAIGACSQCLGKIIPDPNPCRSGSGCRFEGSWSACLYEGALKELIHAFKYKNRRSLAGPLAGILIELVRSRPEILHSIDMVTFVPLHNSRLRDRGFNQSSMLAAAVSREFDVKLADLLEKTHRTRFQNDLSRKDRLTNLKGAFKARNDSDVSGKGVLLIDDVMTTGATLDECSHILKNAGAKFVRCLTLARGM